MLCLVEVYKELSKIFTAEDLEILLMFVMCIRPYTYIGSYIRNERVTEDNRDKLRMVGKRRIDRIERTLRRKVQPSTYTRWQQILLDNPSMEEAWKPKYIIGWPMVFFRNVNIGSYWTTPKKADKRKSVYKSRGGCRVPEYLAETFGDTKTACGICGIKCKRKTG
jgi:hypothetical protein